jgi:hypothetical protein
VNLHCVSLTFLHRSFYVLFYVLIAITYINAKNSIFPNSHLEKLIPLPPLSVVASHPKPIRKMSRKTSKPKPSSSMQCDCPFCPLIAYGKDVALGDVCVNEEGKKISIMATKDKDLAPLADCFKTLYLFARNNVKLKNEDALIMNNGKLTVHVIRDDTQYIITVQQFPNDPEFKLRIHTTSYHNIPTAMLVV